MEHRIEESVWQVFQSDRMVEGEVLYVDENRLQFLTKESLDGPLVVASRHSYVQAVAVWQQKLSADGMSVVLIRFSPGSHNTLAA